MPLASKEIVAPDVFWVGSIDWSVRVFHGYHTDEGTSYNAYLLMDEDVTLIDTVKQSFSQELIERITQVTSLDSVKYVIMNHAENDHSGALPYVMTLLKNATIVTNKICMEHLLLLYPELNLYPFKIVNNSTPLVLKSHTIQFLQVPMLHWPDSMFSYCPDINTLFSNDGFGQHIACSERFIDQVPLQDHVLRQMREYTANILGPCQVPLQTALDNAGSLQIDTILTAHGVSWRDSSIQLALNEYSLFAQNKQLKKKMSIFFHSIRGTVKRTAELIAQASPIQVSMHDLTIDDLTKCALSAYDSEYIAFGSPTIYSQVTPLVEATLQYLLGLHLFKNRKVILFGAFSWVDKAVQDMKRLISNGGGTVISEISFKMQINERVKDQITEDFKHIF
ncbi:A-type_flavoprotein [Hexamita inflata]|uniref:A-type flavoprotein n=1 Tax=Hexamita inflata TaxID=28002 RepID=A0AA86RSE4_9EUKA|nr:A-type flavoprotein [Hexamita inflata]